MSAAQHIADDLGAIAHLFNFARLVIAQAIEGLEDGNNIYDMQRHYDRLQAISVRLLQIEQSYMLSSEAQSNITEWLSTCFSLLRAYAAIAEQMNEDIQYLESSIPETIRLPVVHVESAIPGRRKLEVDCTQLPALLQQQYRLKDIALLSGISIQTLRRRRVEGGILLWHELAKPTGAFISSKLTNFSVILTICRRPD